MYVKETGEFVSGVEPGGSFGELCLMYGTPWLTNIKAKEKSTLWVLGRNDFRTTLKEAKKAQLESYITYLHRLPGEISRCYFNLPSNITYNNLVELT